MLKLKPNLYFRIKSWLSAGDKKKLVAAKFMSVLEYGDVWRLLSESTCSGYGLSWNFFHTIV